MGRTGRTEDLGETAFSPGTVVLNLSDWDSHVSSRRRRTAFVQGVDGVHNCAYTLNDGRRCRMGPAEGGRESEKARWRSAAPHICPQSSAARTRAVRGEAMKAQYSFTGGKRGPV